jgi:ABC-type Fe3+/spermidine/putrescine transport system ATPase subunit
MHVTHDLDEALAVADRLAVLIDGRVRQIGLSDEVLHRPADAEVAGLLGTRNVFAAHLAGGAENGLRFAIANGGPELVAPATSFHPVGSAAGGLCVVIRPEEIEILPDGTASSGLRESVGEAGPNILNGAVREIHFHSSHAVVEIDVPPVLSVHVLRPKLRKLGLERGMRARLYVPPAAIHICARSG